MCLVLTNCIYYFLSTQSPTSVYSVTLCSNCLLFAWSLPALWLFYSLVYNHHTHSTYTSTRFLSLSPFLLAFYVFSSCTTCVCFEMQCSTWKWAQNYSWSLTSLEQDGRTTLCASFPFVCPRGMCGLFSTAWPMFISQFTVTISFLLL